MNHQQMNRFLERIRSEIAPAMGCTEPAAVALCAAGAAAQLTGVPEHLSIEVSEYIFKNAMNVGIPGIQAVGLDIAAAMGAVRAAPEKQLLVLNDLSDCQLEAARTLVARGCVSVAIVKGGEKVYIRACAQLGNQRSEAIIQFSHNNFTRIVKNGIVVMSQASPAAVVTPSETPHDMTVEQIFDFVKAADAQDLAFLAELIRLNSAISVEGLCNDYGLRVGKSMQKSASIGLIAEDVANYAIAVTAAAADARMAGCEKAVMSVGGSGNQGLTATLPIIAVAERIGCSQQTTLKALAMSILLTIHVKHFIGKLSVLCGCSIAASIGVAGALVFLYGGGLVEVDLAIMTMAADISGMVCDGAKPGCALKIATSVSAAMRAATLALSGIGATEHDGIVSLNVELTLKNLGDLGNDGMANTNSAILEMLLHKT